jgi:hypothetical protein
LQRPISGPDFLVGFSGSIFGPNGKSADCQCLNQSFNSQHVNIREQGVGNQQGGPGANGQE